MNIRTIHRKLAFGTGLLLWAAALAPCQAGWFSSKSSKEKKAKATPVAATPAPPAAHAVDPLTQLNLRFDDGSGLQDLSVGVILEGELGHQQGGVHTLEHYLIPHQLKETLSNSGYWDAGATDVIGKEARSRYDVYVWQRKVVSTGQHVALQVKATDSTRRVWIDKQYRYTPTDRDSGDGGELYQPLYNQIANDLSAVLRKASAKRLAIITSTTRSIYAQTYSDKYAGFTERTPQGQIEVVRFPAKSDQVWNAIQNDVFDLEAQFIENFNLAINEYGANMQTAYNDYRISMRHSMLEQARHNAELQKVAAEQAAVESGQKKLKMLYAGLELARRFGWIDKAARKLAEIKELEAALERKVQTDIPALERRALALKSQQKLAAEQSRKMASEIQEKEGEFSQAMLKINIAIGQQTVEIAGTTNQQMNKLRSHLSKIVESERSNQTEEQKLTAVN